MNLVSKILLVWFAPMFCFTRTLSAQDILERARQRLEQTEKDQPQLMSNSTRNGLTLSMDPGMNLGRDSRSMQSKIHYDANLEFGFTCGQFDFATNLKHAFNKELRDQLTNQLIEYAQGELISNGLTLLCTSAPSLCDIFKHYRWQASDFLKQKTDLCQKITDAIDTPERKARAAAFDRCLQEKKAKGVPLTEAISQCDGSPMAYVDLLGKTVSEIRVFEEVKTLFGVDAQTSSHMDWLLGRRRLTPKKVEGESDPDGASKVFEDFKKRRYDSFKRVTEAVQKGQPITDDDVAGLSADPDVNLMRAEILLLMQLDQDTRALIIEMLVTQAAFVDMVRQLFRLEAMLEAATKLPGPQQNATLMDEYKRGIEHLRRTTERTERIMRQKVESQQKLSKAVDAINALARQIAADYLKGELSEEYWKRVRKNLPSGITENPAGNFNPLEKPDQSRKSTESDRGFSNIPGDFGKCDPCKQEQGWGNALASSFPARESRYQLAKGK